MIYLIAILILAVLLFGSSAVVGVIGLVLGGAAALLAAVIAVAVFGVTPGTIMVIGAIAVVTIGVIANYYRQTEKKQAEELGPDAMKMLKDAQRKAAENLKNRA